LCSQTASINVFKIPVSFKYLQMTYVINVLSVVCGAKVGNIF